MSYDAFGYAQYTAQDGQTSYDAFGHAQYTPPTTDDTGQPSYYPPTTAQDGQTPYDAFGHAQRMTSTMDEDGQPQYNLLPQAIFMTRFTQKGL
jgi:hypothetical protein